jgi:predicted dehydrogenase
MKRYVIAGASSRALGMYAKPLVEDFADSAKLAGIYDPNAVRARYVSEQCGGIPTFADFDTMLRATRPDTVIVLTMDRYHHEYIIRALEAGCDAITEKPMTIDDAKVRAILAAEKRTGRTVTVTFNYRYAPYVTRVKELLRQGAVGPLFSVDFEWLLDTRHGADYFRRWHRRLENSGGLFVHKATHHFDLINWWVEDEPERVYAQGALRFYGPTRAERGERCLDCHYAARCEFYVDYRADPTLNALYFRAEGEDGYYRDRCVFSDQIDIYDTMSASVRYKSGVQLTYSLNAHVPYEGWRCTINGRDGRLEAEEWHSGTGALAPSQVITVYNRRGERLTYDIPKATGSHSGGDSLLLQRLFSGRPLPDPLGHAANSWAGAMSVLIGVAANRSVATGEAVRIGDLLRE